MLLSTDIACQTCGDETDKTQVVQINPEYGQNVSQEVTKDIQSLESTIINLESTVNFLEAILEEIIHDYDAT